MTLPKFKVGDLVERTDGPIKGAFAVVTNLESDGGYGVKYITGILAGRLQYYGTNHSLKLVTPEDDDGRT